LNARSSQQSGLPEAIFISQRACKPPPAGLFGEDWAHGLVGYTMGSMLQPPNSAFPNCGAGAPGTFDAPGMYNLSSYHPGGANVLMCDGSVKFLKDSTSQSIVWALGSRAYGEVVSADAY
jgi:prepilin-type processing-associated H-X9-DG protein